MSSSAAATHTVAARGGPQEVRLGEDVMTVLPLGSGCEVGRSAVVVKFKGSTVMFDCGVHPGRTGYDALPFFDEIDPTEVDLLLVTHFHMDHCGALPFFLQKTGFGGRTFMTHPTKAVCKLLLHDSVKIGHDDGRMWDEADLVAAMDRIELINYHQAAVH